MWECYQHVTVDLCISSDCWVKNSFTVTHVTGQHLLFFFGCKGFYAWLDLVQGTCQQQPKKIWWGAFRELHQQIRFFWSLVPPLSGVDWTTSISCGPQAHPRLWCGPSTMNGYYIISSPRVLPLTIQSGPRRHVSRGKRTKGKAAARQPKAFVGPPPRW